MSDQESNSKLITQNPALLAILQLADSFFPTGMYTQSHGLESFIAAGVTGAERLGPLLDSYLLHVAGPGDALAARWGARGAPGRAGPRRCAAAAAARPAGNARGRRPARRAGLARYRRLRAGD